MHVLLTTAQVKALARLAPFDGNMVVRQDGESVEITCAQDGVLYIYVIDVDGKTVER